MSAADLTLPAQVETLHALLKRNEIVYEVIREATKLELKHWYVGAGCVTQTVWNCLAGRPPHENIKDIDLVYFDAEDLSEEGERAHAERVAAHFGELPLEIDVKNEARVHLWYESYFGYPIRPYRSAEDAIDTWPTTATAVGVRLKDRLEVYAPFGLNDLFSRIVRPNKVQITETIYREKAERWKRHWPALIVVPWN